MDKPILVNNKNIRRDYPIISKYFNLSRSENQSIPKKNNIIISSNFVDVIICPICNKSPYKEMFIVDGFRHVQCQSCSHVYIKNPLKEKILIEKYKSSEADKAYIQRMETPFIQKYNKLK